VAVARGELVGSVSILRSDMRTRPALTPWLAQLFVVPTARRSGVGATLVRAAIDHGRRCGYDTLYLYTSGTLPRYYAGLGWRERERVEYLGGERVIMEYSLDRRDDTTS
jgi:predicted N-acetyltransferase YhbS